MEYLWSSVTLLIAGYFIYRFLSRTTKYSFPPGPKGWPLIGNTFNVYTDRFHLSFAKMAKRYGEMFSVTVLGERVVVINSAALIRKAMASEKFGDIFASRPKTIFQTYTLFGRGTIFIESGIIFKQRRKLLHKMINMYGEGIREKESTVLEELKHVIMALENEASPVLDDVFFPSLVNILSIMILGKRFDYGAEEIQTVTKMIEAANKMGHPGVDPILAVFPFLRRIPVGIGRYYKKFQTELEKFLHYYYHEQKATYQSGVSRGLLDVLLTTQDEAAKQNDLCTIDDDYVKATLLDVVAAGVATTRSSLLFLILVILHKPEVANRIQKEIDTVVGSGRFPSLKDRVDMPYTAACILETLRLNTQAALALPHKTTEDVNFEGYNLPANTVVFANLWYVNHNEVLWDKPWDFRPERFFDEARGLLPPECQSRRNLMAFGVGRRSCVGKNFAKSRIFLYVATLLQRLHFRRPNTGEALPPLDPRQFDTTVVLIPDRFKVVVESRKCDLSKDLPL